MSQNLILERHALSDTPRGVRPKIEYGNLSKNDNYVQDSRILYFTKNR